MTISVKQLTNSIETIANFFNEPVEKLDRDTGEASVVNSMAYIQEKVLNGICYNATFQLGKSVEQQDKARSQVKAAIRSHTGDEISENNLNNRLNWSERLDLQVSTVQALLEVAESAHLKHVGKPFSTGSNVRSKPLPAPENMSDAMKRAASMGIITAEGNLGGGVEVAEQEAA